MADGIRRMLLDERLVRTTTEAEHIVSGWLLFCTTTQWDDDVGRLARLVGGREKADRIINRLCEVLR